MNTDTKDGFSMTNLSFRYDLFELIGWLLLALYIGSDLLRFLIQGSFDYATLSENFETFNAAILTIMIPLMFRSIFRKAPLRALFGKIKDLVKEDTGTEAVELSNDVDPLDIWNAKKVANSSPMEYFASLAVSSRKLAKSLRTRSSVYLFIGVIIAFSGLLFFYAQVNKSSDIRTYMPQSNEVMGESNTSTKSPQEENKTNIELIKMAQNFGILFFIEFVAFFFLKQYRAAMDEFRYYESLQRYREETLALMKFKASELRSEAAQIGKESDIFAIIEKSGFRTTSEKLENGQSTELLEYKKLSKEETDIFNKILEIISKK